MYKEGEITGYQKDLMDRTEQNLKLYFGGHSCLQTPGSRHTVFRPHVEYTRVPPVTCKKLQVCHEVIHGLLTLPRIFFPYFFCPVRIPLQGLVQSRLFPEPSPPPWHTGKSQPLLPLRLPRPLCTGALMQHSPHHTVMDCLPVCFPLHAVGQGVSPPKYCLCG